MTIDLVIFDCDGTLVDTEMIHAAGMLKLLESLGVQGLSARDLYARYVGRTVSEMFRDIEYRLNVTLPVDAVDQLFQSRKSLTHKGIPAVPGAYDLLKLLHGQVGLAVASNGFRSEVIYSLESSGLIGFFEEGRIFTKDMVARPKPAPDLFLHACAVCGVFPENSVVIEDSATGVRGAVAAGIRTIGFVGTSDDMDAHAQYLRDAGASDILYKMADFKI